MFLNSKGSRLETAKPIVVEDGRNGDKLELDVVPSSVTLEDEDDKTYVVMRWGTKRIPKAKQSTDPF